MKRSHTVLGLIIIILAVAVLVALAEISVRTQPAQSTPEPNEFVTVLADERIFTLFALLNAAGYDAENFNQPFHPVRAAVREYVAARPLPNLNRWRTQLSFMHSYTFVEWVLHYGQPPEFPRLVSGWHSSAPAFLFWGLEGELRQFYHAAEIDALWQNLQPEYEAEAERYRAATHPAIEQMLAYTRLENSPIGHIVVIPNLLDAHWRGYGPHISNTAYVVIGPTGDAPDVGLIQHEALHSLLGPLIEANWQVIEPNQAERLFNRLRAEVDAKSYGTWPAILEESVINAVGVRLTAPEGRALAQQNDEARGFWLTGPLAEKLLEYEQSSATLADFMPELLQALNQLDAQQLVPPP